MINREATIRWKGYDPDDLKPKSTKRIWVNCDNCGNGRWVGMGDYGSGLCKSCSMSKGAVAQWDVIARSEASDRMIQYHIDHPEARKNQGAALSQKYIDNPEILEKMRNSHIQFHIDHPEERDAMSLRTTEQFSTQEARDAQKERSLEQWSHPIACEKMSAIKQGIPYDDWDGFSGNDWRDWDRAIYANEPFQGCHRHHMTETIVVHIPAELHYHIPHNLKSGYNMGEMNALALQFINGGLEV